MFIKAICRCSGFKINGTQIKAGYSLDFTQDGPILRMNQLDNLHRLDFKDQPITLKPDGSCKVTDIKGQTYTFEFWTTRPLNVFDLTGGEKDATAERSESETMSIPSIRTIT